MKRLYIDVDGVLINGNADSPFFAAHAEAFLDFALARFDCFWCTPWCAGDSRTVIDYLRPYTGAETLQKLMRIKPTRYSTLKTEPLTDDFYWIEDSPLAAEVSELCRRGALDRWIDINTRVRPDDLLRAVELLRSALTREPAPPRIARVRYCTDFPQWIAAN